MKMYNLQKLFNTTESGERETVVFISEVNSDAKGLTIPPSVNIAVNSLHYLANQYQHQLVKADIFAVRFLKEGISVLRGNRYRSDYEGNPWKPIVSDFMQSADSQRITDDPSGQINDAFNRWCVSIKPAKFLLSLGATNVEAEQFSHDYFRTFGERPENAYTFELVEGKAIQDAYRNPYGSGTIQSSCMSARNRTTQVGWYAKQRGYIKLAVLRKEDGYIYARAIVWMNTTVTKGDTLIYSGPIADRQYYANSHAKQALINRLNENGIPYKLNDSYGGSDIVNSSGATMFNTENTTVKAEIRNVSQKRYPFIDTLPIIGERYASNNISEGVNIQAQSVQGNPTYRGEYRTVNAYACTGQLENVRELAMLLLPDGSTRHAYRSEAEANGWIKAHVGGDPWSIPTHYVKGSLTSEHVIEVSRQGRTDPRTLTVQAYPHQLGWSDGNSLELQTLWIAGRQEYRPLSDCIFDGDTLTTKARRRRQVTA